MVISDNGQSATLVHYIRQVLKDYFATFRRPDVVTSAFSHNHAPPSFS
ncbi:hypothetical protein DSM3645_19648 [Blastopirellula marina DSM 3645]|uniref:Uncharacterized protein n=1 Tax=Blastopirellula marina DSM 3645 TaxID=314230 RepID=A3ZT70_9BACT|nr:hypothetical protein DSM3645_19648 [Blastopirellula marina DSM 3645]